MENQSKCIEMYFNLSFNALITLSNFLHFLTSRVSNFARVNTYLKVYRQANPLACAWTLSCLSPTNSQKHMFLYKKSKFSYKNSRNLQKGPSDPESPGTSISYYSSCIMMARKWCSTSQNCQLFIHSRWRHRAPNPPSSRITLEQGCAKSCSMSHYEVYLYKKYDQSSKIMH